MNQMQEFRAEATRRGLCKKYSELWDSCLSNKQLLDLSMDSNGIPYLCKSIIEGWGLSVGYIAHRFRMYINNKYTSKHNGYTSKLYVRHFLNIIVDTTNTVILCSNTFVIVPKNTICNIHLVNSDIEIIGEGVCYVTRYGHCSVKSGKKITVVFDEL